MSAWQTQLRDCITSVDALCAALQLDPAQLPLQNKTLSQFPLRVPKAFAARMQPGNPQDPLLLQVLPQQAELEAHPGYTQDPLQEAAHNPTPGLLHKYHGRVLLTLTGGCAIHCRYCFRQHFPYEENTPSGQQWQRILNYIQNNMSIEEVIFSGGDPLLLKDELLQRRIESLEAIPHLQRLRIHSRLPIVIPERITPTFIQLLTNSRLTPILITHCNHPQEIDTIVGAALQNLSKAGISVLNQAVLLAGINEDSAVLSQLGKRLFQYGTLPYYLHLMDPVAGTQHFDVAESRAKELMQQLSCQLPGYLLPKLVREIPGKPHKTLIAA